MIQRDKLQKVEKGQENKGVSPAQKKNLAEDGLKMAKQLGIYEPIEDIDPYWTKFPPIDELPKKPKKKS